MGQTPSQSSLDNCTYKLSAEAKDEVDGDVVVTAYAWGGHEVHKDSPDAIAKKAFDPNTGIERYWLKRATTGQDRGMLFNPQSPMFAGGQKTISYLGQGRYEYKKATRESFDLYMQFIVHPHNPHNLRGAERL